MMYTLKNWSIIAKNEECAIVHCIYNEVEYYRHRFSQIIAKKHQVIGLCCKLYFVVQKSKNNATLIKTSKNEAVDYLFQEFHLKKKRAKKVKREIKEKIKLGRKEKFPLHVKLKKFCSLKFAPFVADFTLGAQEPRQSICNLRENGIVWVKLVSDYGEYNFALSVLRVRKHYFIAKYMSLPIAALLRR